MDANIEIRTSEDGSHTLYNKHLNETYHSIHGAYTESMHVFIKNGLELISKENISVFEVGFGTGLNAYLTYLYQQSHAEIKEVHYHSIELFPLNPEIFKELNYPHSFGNEAADVFFKMHQQQWGVKEQVKNNFWLHKLHEDFTNFLPVFMFDLVYFDAFAPDVQPHLWETAIFERLFAALKPGGVLSTYSAKGQVRRNLQSVGFRVERKPGPPGKREMLVAFKDK